MSGWDDPSGSPQPQPGAQRRPHLCHVHVTLCQPGKAPGGALSALASPSLPHPMVTIWRSLYGLHPYQAWAVQSIPLCPPSRHIPFLWPCGLRVNGHCSLWGRAGCRCLSTGTWEGLDPLVGWWACCAPSTSPSAPRLGEESAPLISLVLYRTGRPWFGFLLGAGSRERGRTLCSRVLTPGTPYTGLCTPHHHDSVCPAGCPASVSCASLGPRVAARLCRPD